MVGLRAELAVSSLLIFAAATPSGGAALQSPCEHELRFGTVCSAASETARRLFEDRRISGTVVVEDVATGQVVAEASVLAENPVGATVSSISSMLPLSTSKLLLAASIWAHADAVGGRQTLDRRVREMLLHSIDEEGRKLAVEERARLGSSVVLADLARYGVPACVSAALGDTDIDHHFAGHMSALITVRRACTTLSESDDDASWGDALSLGETKFSLTPFHLLRFMQAVGNDGVAFAPEFRRTSEPAAELLSGERMQMMTPAVAHLLQRALLDTVSDGTAKGIRGRLRGGWQIGGKTGTTALYREPFDGIFAGLVFDPHNAARYAFVVYAQRGGKGGGAAAEIACDLFNYILGL